MQRGDQTSKARSPWRLMFASQTATAHTSMQSIGTQVELKPLYSCRMRKRAVRQAAACQTTTLHCFNEAFYRVYAGEK